MLVSILIPVKGDNEFLRECIAGCRELDYKDFEIIVLPDDDIDATGYGKVKFIPTGAVGPAQKRDIGAKQAKGEILAFLDDDTLPAKNWLANAVAVFKDPAVGAVCGPAITPVTDSPRRRASGRVYESFFVSGAHRRRYMPTQRCEVDDYPSCNFLVRADVFKRIGRFDTGFWPGEDTVLCLKIVRDAGKKIIYDPGVLVYHHRRQLFREHYRQIKSYALHRGYFVRRFPRTSLRLAYFIPSIFLIGVAFGAIFFTAYPETEELYYTLLEVYLLIIGISVLFLKERFKVKVMIFGGIVLTHFTYGFFFLKGLVVKRLAEE
ncbi:MAG: glycosyltransferase [Candidatus Omnitrophota bacterium]